MWKWLMGDDDENVDPGHHANHAEHIYPQLLACACVRACHLARDRACDRACVHVRMCFVCNSMLVFSIIKVCSTREIH